MNVAIAALSLGALMLAASAGAQDRPAPKFVTGDRWSYRETDLLTKLETGHLSETVTAVDATEYWIDARRATRTWWRGEVTRQLHREQFVYSEEAADHHGKLIASDDAGWPTPGRSRWEQSSSASRTSCGRMAGRCATR